MAIGAYNLDAYLDMEDETRWWPWPEDEDLPDMDGRDGEDVGACEAVHDRVKRERCVTGHVSMCVDGDLVYNFCVCMSRFLVDLMPSGVYMYACVPMH